MSGVTGDIKKLFNFKYKTRDDSVSDQYNRVFMVKAMLVASFLTGMSWYSDKVKCIVPSTAQSPTLGDYAAKACWINGFYIYKDLRDIKNFEGYYGIPKNLQFNGITKDKETCFAKPKSKNCIPMEKMFYLQYQWFPFYMAALAILYYIPYLMFRIANEDMASLKTAIKPEKADLNEIVRSYFTRSVNSPQRQYMRIVLNALVKICYLIPSVLSLVFTDNLLNGEYIRFGKKWMKWSELPNNVAHNYVGIRKIIKPGEMLLPTFGLCDVLELGQDIKYRLANTHTVVCEISQHVLYHYVLMALWFLFIIGMVVSCIGIISLLLSYVLRSVSFANSDAATRRVYESLSLREAEYLDFIRKNNVPYYGQLIRKLNGVQAEGVPLTGLLSGDKGEELSAM